MVDFFRAAEIGVYSRGGFGPERTIVTRAVVVHRIVPTEGTRQADAPGIRHEPVFGPPLNYGDVQEPLQPDGFVRFGPPLGLRFEPQLEQLDRLLDDDEIVEAVRADMARRCPRSRSRGRPSTPVEVVLRKLVVMRLYGWSYAQAKYFVNDSLLLRQFCRVYLQKVPDDTTLIRWANTIGPVTLQAFNDRVVQLARSLKATRGRRLRVNTTAVETNIHFPTDSGLVCDRVRVVSRLLRRAKAVLGEAASGLKEAFRSRVRTVRKLSQRLHYSGPRISDHSVSYP